MTIGKGEASINCTVLHKLAGQVSSGPSSVRRQSNAQMRSAISPFQPSQPWLSDKNCID
jgi:hypothetical protein